MMNSWPYSYILVHIRYIYVWYKKVVRTPCGECSLIGALPQPNVTAFRHAQFGRVNAHGRKSQTYRGWGGWVWGGGKSFEAMPVIMCALVRAVPMPMPLSRVSPRCTNIATRNRWRWCASAATSPLALVDVGSWWRIETQRWDAQREGSGTRCCCCCRCCCCW